MSQDSLIRLQCKDCKRYNYYAHKNKKKIPKKLEINKFCSDCRKQTAHKETKK